MPRWFLWTLVALVSWGLWAVASQLIGDAVSPAHSQAISTLGMLPVIGALACLKQPPAPGNASVGIGCAFAAGIVTSLANLAFYAALQRGEKAAAVIPLTALYPVVTIALAFVFLHERLNHVQLAGVALSLVAIYLFNVRKEAGFLSTAVVHALTPIALWGLSGLLQKISTNHVSGEASALWFLLAFVPVAILIIAFHPPDLGSISGRTWLLAAALGLLLAWGNFAILAAFAAGGQASIIAPLGGIYPLISVPIAVVFLHEKVSLRELAGLVVAVLAVVALSLETRRPQPTSACNPLPNS